MSPRKERFLNGVMDFDDDVAKLLYSPDRLVPTYDKSQAVKEADLRNNYDGQTPDPSYIDDWTLTLSGLASGKTETLTLRDLASKFAHHEQVTRLVCVEGWSAIAWWGGLRFADFLAAYPPRSDAKWARIGLVRQSRWRRQLRSVFRLDRLADRPTPADPPGDPSVRAQTVCRAWSAAASDRADETRPEEHQGDHGNHVFSGGAQRLLELPE